MSGGITASGALMAVGGSIAASSLMKMLSPAAPAASVTAPTVTPPTPMPDEKTVRDAAARTSLMEQQRRRGRASTILTDPAESAADPLGG